MSGKNVDGFSRWSYVSKVGVALVNSKLFGTVAMETETRLHWLHEFNAEDEEVGYSLSGGAQKYDFIMQSQDEDVFAYGIGISANWPNGIQVRADFDGQSGQTFSSKMISASLLYRF